MFPRVVSAESNSSGWYHILGFTNTWEARLYPVVQLKLEKENKKEKKKKKKKKCGLATTLTPMGGKT
jgi:hypothetical protein